MKRICYFLFVLLLVVACRPEPTPPYAYEMNPNYTYMGLSYYGQYYPNNDQHVFSLTFYSEGMVNEDSTAVEPPGQELYIEDLFVPGENFENLVLSENDTVLTDSQVLALLRGTYTASEKYGSDTFGKAFTFAPGEYSKIDSITYILGARITYYEEEDVYSKRVLLTGGQFTVNDAGIEFEFVTESGDTLGGNYRAAGLKRVPVRVEKKSRPGRRTW